MKNCELLASISVNSGVAVNLSRDTITSMLLNGECLMPDDIKRIATIADRLRQANASAVYLLENCARRKNSFWEAEQFQLFARNETNKNP